MTAVPAPLVRESAEPPAPTPAPITCAGIAAHESGVRYIRLDPDTLRPYVGILGVLIGAILSFTGSRITTFGLADLRGGLHFGFDEGAWMTTSFGVGQMLVGVACPYLGAIFSVRRILLYGMALLFIAALLGPLSPNLTAFLTAQFLAGVGTGTFIPLTIGFIVRNLPQRLVVYGLAVYAMNSELSQNVSASLEGWYTENFSWRWIQWQFCIAVPVMFACIWYGAPREKINLNLLRDLDWPGLAYSGIGFSLLYAGLDQGNRLDWVNNGLVNGLLLSGTLLTLAFVVRELIIDKPFLNLRLLAKEGIVPILLILAGFRFIILSTAYIIPTYLQVVQDYRELQVGAVLLWIALPQFLIVLPLGWLLSRIDARWILATGAILIGVACLMATLLTQDWATDDFLPSQILQAIGQSFALTAVVVLAVKSMNPADVLTIGTLFQTVRLFGGEIGTAFMQTFVRVREQVHSNLIGLHVDSLGVQTADRLAAYRNAMIAHSSDVGVAAERATSLLGSAVAKQAAVLSYIDGFLAAAVGAFVCLMFTALLAAWLIWYTAGHWDRWTGAARFESTDDAFVSGDVTPLSARVSGNITEMPVNDFQLVRKGDLLAVIDPSDYQAQLDLAKANLAAAEATLANLANQRIVQQSLVQQAEATIDATEADVLRYQLEDKRQRDLLRTGIAGTQQLVEQADDNSKRAIAQRRLNEAQLDQQKAALAAIDIQEKQLKAQIKAAEAQVALASDNLRYTRILSPADGLVGQRQVRLGQFVNVGTQVIAVVPLPNIWVIANYKETQMTDVRLGQPARISVDAFPDLKLTGHVDSWSPGTGSTFALLPPDNATGNFTKVVQRVPVKIVLDQNESLGSLVRPGMSVEATIDTGAAPSQGGSGAAASVTPRP